jgi:hypothetical protein
MGNLDLLLLVIIVSQNLLDNSYLFFNSEQKVEECDATNVESSTDACNIIITHIKKRTIK